MHGQESTDRETELQTGKARQPGPHGWRRRAEILTQASASLLSPFLKTFHNPFPPPCIFPTQGLHLYHNPNLSLLFTHLSLTDL
jgi:hypothetical protein